MQFFIDRAKSCEDSDEAKTWLLTATTFLPGNFDIQFECYLLTKKCRDAKQSVVHLERLCKLFPSEPRLIAELRDLTASLRSEHTSETRQFLRQIFCHLSQDVQLHVLSTVVDRSSDILEHCTLLLLLIKQFPHMIDTHAARIVDTLLDSEEKKFPQRPVNPYRKCLVIDVLPTVLSASSSSCLSSSALLRLFLLSLEYYTASQLLDFELPGVSAESRRSSSLDDQAIDDMTSLLLLFCRHLSWHLGSDMFSQTRSRELLWQLLATHADHQSSDSCVEAGAVEQLVFCCLVVLMQCVLVFCRSTHMLHTSGSSTLASPRPASGVTPISTDDLALFLVPAFRGSSPSWSDAPAAGTLQPGGQFQRRRSGGGGSTVSQEVVVTVSEQKRCRQNDRRSDPTSALTIGVQCLKLLHSQPQYQQVLQQVWCSTCFADSTGLASFLLSAQVYVQDWSTVAAAVPLPLQLQQLMSGGSSPSGQCHRSLITAHSALVRSDLKCCVEVCLHVLSSQLPASLGQLQLDSYQQLVCNAPCRRHVRLLAFCRVDIISYCVKLLLTVFQTVVRESPRRACDMAVGHLIVLSQFDWPSELDTFRMVLELVKSRGRLVYPQFSNYVTCADIIEQMVFLNTERPGCLQLLPRSSQANRARTMSTRGVDKGAREEFRAAMLAQIQRDDCPLTLMVEFVSAESSSLIQSIS